MAAVSPHGSEDTDGLVVSSVKRHLDGGLGDAVSPGPCLAPQLPLLKGTVSGLPALPLDPSPGWSTCLACLLRPAPTFPRQAWVEARGPGH